MNWLNKWCLADNGEEKFVGIATHDKGAPYPVLLVNAFCLGGERDDSRIGPEIHGYAHMMEDEILEVYEDIKV